MSTTHERDYKQRFSTQRSGRFLPGTSIEVLDDFRPIDPPRFAVFDFDGTLSLVREGWPEVMCPIMVEVLAATGTRESKEELTAVAMKFIMELNGKQTIYQMIRLAEEVTKRGGKPEDPNVYKQLYHERLMDRIATRRES